MIFIVAALIFVAFVACSLIDGWNKGVKHNAEVRAPKQTKSHDHTNPDFY